ncbi:hypothetical protein BBJ28_00006113 [Nothophytophthora sp. Chile5]|nr:hypothetical protein BBJ28_00006113 [Nothophytophthora sp. Chile5]
MWQAKTEQCKMRTIRGVLIDLSVVTEVPCLMHFCSLLDMCDAFKQLNEAFRVLLDGGPLIALHEARYFAVRDGLNLGPGAFVKALEFSAGVQATIIGVIPEEAVMIGDDVRQDVHGAMALGMHGVLVQTGKYRKGDEDQIGVCFWR